MKFVVCWILTAVAVMFAAWVVPGMGFVGSDFAAALWTALALAFVNTWIKPLLSMMALPLTIVSLGLFALVINAGMLELASFFARNIFHAGVYVGSFGSALLGAIVISVVSALLGAGADE